MEIKIDTVYNCDCLELMRKMARGGGTADWVITDPPYGINAASKHQKNAIREAENMRKYGKPYENGKGLSMRRIYHQSDEQWDKARPDKEVFDLMRQVSKNQVIFGGNYFADMLPPSSCWIVWDKLNGDNDFADCELAWTSLDTAVRKVTYLWNGMLQGNMQMKEKRIHPTQKPLPVIEWILNKYTKEGDLILDPFMGSFTTAVACHKLNRHYIGAEIDKEYFRLGTERLNTVKAQVSLFD